MILRATVHLLYSVRLVVSFTNFCELCGNDVLRHYIVIIADGTWRACLIFRFVILFIDSIFVFIRSLSHYRSMFTEFCLDADSSVRFRYLDILDIHIEVIHSMQSMPLTVVGIRRTYFLDHFYPL